MDSPDGYTQACAAIEDAIAYCVENGHTIAAAHLQHGLDVLVMGQARAALAAAEAVAAARAVASVSDDSKLPAAHPSAAGEDHMIDEGKAD